MDYYYNYKKDEQGCLVFDQRGKHRKQRMIKEEIIQGIRDHIKSFPKKTSHYCRKRNNKEYLYGSLNIATMYCLYVGHCKSYNIEVVYVFKCNNYRNKYCFPPSKMKSIWSMC